jgi:hypothetical protein
MGNITIFKSIKDTSAPFYRSVDYIIHRIKEGKSKDIVKRIREEKDKEKRNQIKKELPAICFSGEFTRREDSALVSHSGVICLDFDGFSKKADMLAKKEEFTKDKYTLSVFISPSGDGLKLLVKIPADEDKHKSYFKSLEKYYNCEQFDKTSKNISRVCYESYDPLIFHNPESKEWDKVSEEEFEQIKRPDNERTITLTDQNEIVRRLRLWWERQYGIVVGERNANVYILAAAFNDFGVNKELASYVLGEFAHDDFPLSEIKTTIDSAYRKEQNFNTKFFEDRDAIDSVRRQIKKGVPKKEIRQQLRDSGLSDGVSDAVMVKIEEDSSSKEFWTKSSKGAVSVVHYLLKEFLEDNGYFKYSPEGTKNYIFVKVTNNLISNASEDEIKDFVLEYLFNMEDLSIYNHFADKTRYFKEDFLSLLSPVDVYFVEDDKDNAYLYYRNCAVKANCNEIVMIDYIDLGGYVWKDQVIDRDFEICDAHDCDFKTFISNISGAERDRVRSVESTVGFLLHSYKNHGYCPAVIINDEVITDNPEGGTGKGLFMNAISRMKKSSVIDGKSFNFERSFAYQTVSTDTQIIVFDDVRRNFDFERLFSIVTEGITLEKKNKDAIKIPFHKSPKVVITTNYAIKGKGNSFERRKWELEFKQYYNKDFTPHVEFGRLLFEDWNDDDWCKFDNYMVNNLKNYLCFGFIKSDFKNLKTRKFIAETDHSFWEWMTDSENRYLRTNSKIYKEDVYKDFVLDNPDFGQRGKTSISLNKFYKWLESFGMFYTGETVEQGRDGSGRWIKFVKKEPEQSEFEF